MSSEILNKINEKITPFQLNKYLYTDILQDLYHKLYTCYHHQLITLINKEERDIRLCEIVHTHCYNQSVTTKTAIKQTLQKTLSDKQYKNFGLKLIYAIMDVGKEITDDPYSAQCYSKLLSQELNIMDVDPRLEAIAMKIMKKVNLVQNTKYGSIILVVMIIGIVLSLIRVIQECNKNKLLKFNKLETTKFMYNEIQNICIKRTLLNKWRLKKIIKDKLSTEDYKAYGLQLQDAIFSTGLELTEEESFTLVEAANV
jgi:hypothetical protein